MTKRDARWLIGGILVAVLTVYGIAWQATPPEGAEGIVAVPVVPYHEAAAAIDAERIRAHLAELTATPSRMIGRPGHERAYRYLCRQLESLGLDEIRDETVEVVVPIDGDTTLTLADGERFELHPLWPNSARTCRTAPEGLSGPLVYGGKGRPEELAGTVIEDSIVVLDWKSELQWLLVPSLGAKAVLFLPNPEATQVHARNKYFTLPADLPRYYVPDEHADRIRELALRRPSVQATVRCSARWETRIASNLIATIPCATLRDASEPWEPVVLTAYYDSVSVVPALAPGAEQACSVAVLLELLRYFKQHPLEDRDLVVFLSGAHTPAMEGMKQFVRTHLLEPGPREEPPWKPWLVASLDLSTGTRRVAACHIGAFANQFFLHIRPWISRFALRIDRYAEQIGATFGVDPGTILVDAVNPKRGRNLWVYFPYSPAFQSELSTLAGVPSLCFATADDARLRVDTPEDKLEHLRFGELEAQARTLAALFANLFRLEGKVLTGTFPSHFTALQGRVVSLDPETSYIPDDPRPGLLVEARTLTSPKYQVGVRATPRLITDASGEFRFDGLTHIASNGMLGHPKVEAFGMDAETGRITWANDYSSARAQDYPSTIALDEPVKNLSIVVFPCDSVTLFGMSDPLTYQRLSQIKVFDAGTNSPPFQYGYSEPDALIWDREEPAVVVFANEGTPLRLALGVGPLENRLVLLNSKPDNPMGTGFDISKLSSIRSMFFQGAWDLWHLNQDRLDLFHEVGISPQRVLRLHRQSREHLDAAGEALARRDYHDFVRESFRGWSLEARAYPEVLSTANDMIHGVIFYLFLLLPFAYCFERLVVSASTVMGRILGLFTTFLAGFVGLVLVHPAFRLTITPLLVLLAFIILALSVTVIAIVIRKFDRMMWELRTASTGLHESDVSRAGAAARAIDLGIGNLRRRRQRTILTCLTLILVTFTLLSFTSIIPELVPRHVRYGKGEPTYEGLLYRDRSWWPMPLEQYTALALEHAGVRPIAGRIWMFSEMVGQTSAIELFAGQEDLRRITVQALVGLEPAEAEITPVTRTLVAGRWFLPGEERAVILPRRLARLLDLGEADLGRPVNVYGEAMPLVGLVDEERFIELRDIDGEPLTPVNYLLMAQRLQEEGPPDETEFEEYIHLLTNDVAILPFEFLKIMEPTVRSVAIRYDSGEEVLADLEEITKRTEQTVFACADGEISVFSAVNRLAISATGGLLIPVVIGALIVLASMLGAVFERRREIGVFNAVGLAPLHVSSLFLAEATVFALLGGIAGYLIGQIVARSLIWLNLLPGVTLNYSAASTIIVTAFTMIVAILSTIYPAIQAYRIAMPEDPALRHRPETEGDHMEVDLPFTATGDDAYGVNAYLHEFLDAHLEASVGNLSTEKIRVHSDRAGDQPRLHIDFRAWLVPFDLGVSQDCSVVTAYDEDTAGFRLRLAIDRYSGDHNAWERTNRHFLTILRKQFLIWRIISQREKDSYIERGKALFA